MSTPKRTQRVRAIGYFSAAQDEPLSNEKMRRFLALGCREVRAEEPFARHQDRVELRHLISELSAGSVLCILRLEHLGASATNQVRVIHEVLDAGATIILAESAGKTVIDRGFTAYGLAQILLDAHQRVTLEKSRRGREAARALDRRGGRPTVMTAARKREVLRLLESVDAEGRPRFSYGDIAAEMGVSRSTIARHAKALTRGSNFREGTDHGRTRT